MLTRVAHETMEKLGDTAKVVVPNSLFLFMANHVDINRVLSAISILLTIAYTVWRWRRDSKKTQ